MQGNDFDSHEKLGNSILKWFVQDKKYSLMAGAAKIIALLKHNSVWAIWLIKMTTSPKISQIKNSDINVIWKYHIVVQPLFSLLHTQTQDPD